ncbi:unnamed protein product [Closterium sp. NIES-54]
MVFLLPGGAELGATEPGGAEPGGAGSARVAFRGASSRREVLSAQELREWFARRWGRAAGAGGTTAPTGSGGTCPGGAGAAGPGGAPEAAGVGPTGGSAGASGGTAGAPGAGGAAGAGAPASSGSAPRPRPYIVPLVEQPVSPLPAPSPYTGPTGGLAERRAPVSRPASPACPACTSRRTSRPRPPAVPGTHQMALCPSTAPLRVPLPSPPASSLPAVPDPESDSLRAASPTVARFLATVVTDPSLASTAASALVAELVDFAARCRLDYAAGLVAESAYVCPSSVGGECALSTDVLEDRQEEFQCFAAALPHLAAMDAEMASWKSTGTYVDEVPPPGANIVTGLWIFRVKRPPGSLPVFKARYVARDFSQQQGVDYFQTFSPTPKMTTLRVLLHVAAQRDYELHSLDFSTAFLQGSLHEEIWLRRPPGFTGSFPPGTQWSLRRPVYGLRQAPPARAGPEWERFFLVVFDDYSRALVVVVFVVSTPNVGSSSQSPQQPLALLRHVTVDSRGVGVGGAATGGPRTEGARLRGAGAGGTGTGGASCGGAGAGSADTGGASSADAGAGSAGTGGASSGGAGAGGVRAGVSGTGGASFEATGAGGTATVAPTAPPHRYNTRLQALCQLEREEQKRLEQKRQELRQLDQREQQQVPQE